MLLCDFCDVSELFVEGLIPATHMAVTTRDVEERSLVEGLDGLAVAFFERDRHERFDSRGEADFQNRVLSAMRFGFGGHVEKK